MGTSIPPCSGAVTIYWHPVKKGRAYSDRIPDKMSEEPGRGQLEETTEVAWIFLKNNQAATDPAYQQRECAEVVG